MDLANRNIEAPAFALLIGQTKCWSCDTTTRAAALWVPSHAYWHEPDWEPDHDRSCAPGLRGGRFGVGIDPGSLPRSVDDVRVDKDSWLHLSGQLLRVLRTGAGRSVSSAARRGVLPEYGRPSASAGVEAGRGNACGDCHPGYE